MKFPVLLGCCLLFAACVDGNYFGGPQAGGNRTYGYDYDYDSGGYYPGRRYPRHSPRYDPRYDNYPYYDYRYDHGYDRQHHGRKDENKVYVPAAPPAPPAKPVEQVIRPNCPSGTKFDGRHCIIVDQRLRKPGGDGRINPCPKGMWVSGDRCVGNQ